MAFKHLTENERFLIDKLWKEGKNITEISKTISRAESTIFRELKRNSTKNGYGYFSALKMSQERKFVRAQLYKADYSEFEKLFFKLFERHYHGVRATIEVIKQKHPNVLVPHWRTVYYWINSGTWICISIIA
ncbi:hypothetical protein CJJ23_03315 [Mycoplasmopsis agassizii]|uniref:Transposase IS30-like HTH domain-containing protein n=1 Tax=Mycoplasmopsis agassizii TaxID=33922 RepID=A0A269TIE3_9BACT|nr:helix-turn-helix domain-containing protein [Mycoplasmopsis agassizii]PAK21214.1 hypothetical protein CJJ23_03315 [Mycoplasmopsis agassizii]